MTSEKKYLGMAVKIAGDGIREGAGPFGAIVVLNDEVIAGANNRVVLDSDPTAHAEILAIRKAAAIIGSHRLTDCVLYTSCEPCPMCLGAIYWAGIRKVVYSSSRYEAAAAGFSDEFIYKEIALDNASREVVFSRIEDPAADQVFREWLDFEDKKEY